MPRLFFHFLALLCLSLLFLPKLNLIHFERETAGIRIDDFVLAFFCFFIGCAAVRSHRNLTRLELLLGAIICSALISFLLNRLFFLEDALNVDAKIFYVFRTLEYFLFFYAGSLLAKKISLEPILALFLCVNVGLMALQKAGLVVRITGFNANTLDTVRVSGLASFPSEMGALLSMMFAYALSKAPSNSPKIWRLFRPWCLLLLYFPLTLLTGARIALVSVLAVFIVFLFRHLRFYQFLLLSTIVGSLIAIPLYYLTSHTDGVGERSASLFSLKNFEIITRTWETVDTRLPLYDNILLTEGNYDLSWWIRLHKWCYALKTYFQQPLCYIFGAGPGAFSAALDGGWIRILTENGILGVFLYYAFFRELSKISVRMRWVVVAFFFNMIFFDTYLAYKVMSLLFLMAGFEAAVTVYGRSPKLSVTNPGL